METSGIGLNMFIEMLLSRKRAVKGVGGRNNFEVVLEEWQRGASLGDGSMIIHFNHR